MNHVAIDLGSKESQICMRAPDGAILMEGKRPTRELSTLLKTWERSRVIVETASEAFGIADAARRAGHEVKVVPSILSKQLGVGERGVKTDLKDARKLSEVSCRIDLPSVHVPTAETRELRSLLQSRRLLVAMRTQAVNHVRGWLRTQLGRVRSGWAPTLPGRIRAFVTQSEREMPAHIEQILISLEHLNQQVTAMNAEVRRRAKACPVCQRLMTVPGVGFITALTFVATLEETKRFARAHRVASYLGLAPGENSSSERQQRTGITKAGPSQMRFTLIQAAWACLRRYQSDPMTLWANQIAARRGKHIAVVALARKLSGVMFAVWRDQTSYRVPSVNAPLPTEVAA